MRMPKWLRVKVRVEVSVKVSAALRVAPYWIAWAILLLYCLLTHGQGNLPVHWTV